MTTTDDHDVQRFEGEAGPSHPEEHQRPDAGLAAASRPGDDAESLLRTFVHAANLSLLHPEDLRRFDDFVAISRREGWLATTVEAKLLSLGMPAELAQQLRRRFFNRVKPVPLAGVGRQELNEQIAALNERLGCGRNASHQG